MVFNLLSFKWGIHPHGNKHFTQHKTIEKAKVPPIVYIPLQQHIGAPCEALVKPGDQVRLGQIIGQPKGFVSAPIHSSVSGKVKSIEPFANAQGNKTTTIIIENDGLDTLDESIKPRDTDDLSSEDIKSLILEAGIVGMGGATFPTHVKLSPPIEKNIDAVILNGAECEPYLTADHRMMIEQPHIIIKGLKLIMRSLNVYKGYIGIEDNKTDAIAAMEKANGNDKDIIIKPLKTKYPQGAEKQLIEVITGHQVPSGGLPMDVGVVVNNVATATAIYNGVSLGMPLIERIVTVTGDAIEQPKNLLVRIGTLFSDLVEQCGGFSSDPSKVISGGPMMGIAQYTLEVPVMKGTSGILALSSVEVTDNDILPCIRCARCIRACPIHLMPLSISAHSLKGDYDASEKLNAIDCIECGSCSYICPAKRPLLQSIRLAKREIIDKRKRNTQ
ncbi:MAG TPA: electron transport complex subunit RsxC [Clostridia bacterium]|nr:electron transport complex subunit RsxC [Clostridia bacterium]